MSIELTTELGSLIVTVSCCEQPKSSVTKIVYVSPLIPFKVIGPLTLLSVCNVLPFESCQSKFQGGAVPTGVIVILPSASPLHKTSVVVEFNVKSETKTVTDAVLEVPPAQFGDIVTV